MASIVITINTGGAAFHRTTPDNIAIGTEVARILRVLAERYTRGEYGIVDAPSFDIDGHPCGTIELIE